ncbi:HAD family hydrolase [Devriesea agamarum]|uniref:HAD family hydrolase n=1 Tax=Devriesea agamarum TaxID=472569 RepID=UPI00155E8A12|nr:HAD family phosphatase [Devriesea agamarum]
MNALSSSTSDSPPLHQRLLTAFGTWTPEAVVFDCDGLLLNTEQVWVETYTEFMAETGVELPADCAASLVGASADRVVATVAELVHIPAAEVATKLFTRHLQDVEQKLCLLPGAQSVLHAAAERVPVAIASNTPGEFLRHKLETAGIADVPQHIISVDDVDAPKPAPDMYTQAATRLGVRPAHALAMEDSRTGVQSARAAGLRVLAVPSGPGEMPDVDISLRLLDDPGLLAWISAW